MNRIDRYTSWLFLGYFVGGLLVFVTIFTAVDAMSTLVSYKDIAMGSLFEYYSYMAPEIILKMLPIACLLGVILTLSSMNKANELVALFSSGMSLFRICIPMLLGVIVISFLGFLMGDRVMPTMTKKKNFVFYNDIKRKPNMYSIVKTDRIWYRSKNSIFNIKTLSPDGTKAEGLTLYFFSNDWDLLQMLTAKHVNMVAQNWALQDGSVTVFSQDSSFPLTSEFKTKSIVMAEDSKDLQSAGQTSDTLSQSELKRFIDKNKEAGLDTLAYEVDYSAKYSFAFAGLVMCLLGIPFSVGRARSGGTMLNAGISLGLVFAYYILYSSGITLGQHGTLPPIVASWAPNVIMTALAILFFVKSRR